MMEAERSSYHDHVVTTVAFDLSLWQHLQGVGFVTMATIKPGAASDPVRRSWL